MWARGYSCATVGTVDEATIKAYIESQKWDEDDQGFKITAPTERLKPALSPAPRARCSWHSSASNALNGSVQSGSSPRMPGRQKYYSLTRAGRKQLELETSDWTRRASAIAGC
jgi:hypothetical protein